VGAPEKNDRTRVNPREKSEEPSTSSSRSEVEQKEEEEVLERDEKSSSDDDDSEDRENLIECVDGTTGASVWERPEFTETRETEETQETDPETGVTIVTVSRPSGGEFEIAPSEEEARNRRFGGDSTPQKNLLRFL